MLQKKLPNVSVKFAMRYQSPSIKSVLDDILSENPDELIVLPLFPHYAAATTGSVYKEVSRCFRRKVGYTKCNLLLINFMIIHYLSMHG